MRYFNNLRFAVHMYTCTLYVTRKRLTILISDFSLKIASFCPPPSTPPRCITFLVLCRWSSSILFIRVFAQILFNCCCSTKIHGKTNGDSNYHSWNYLCSKICVRWVGMTTHTHTPMKWFHCFRISVNCVFICNPQILSYVSLQ